LNDVLAKRVHGALHSRGWIIGAVQNGVFVQIQNDNNANFGLQKEIYESEASLFTLGNVIFNVQNASLTRVTFCRIRISVHAHC
jgi:hypothetical protein